MSDWRDLVAADRMAVDREFADRVRESSLTPQQWNVAMTAIEFAVEHPEDPERARIVADTSRLPGMAAEIRAARTRSTLGAGGSDGGGGLFASLKRRLLGGDPAVEEAERLATAYARALQARLEEEGKFERVLERARA